IGTSRGIAGIGTAGRAGGGGVAYGSGVGIDGKRSRSTLSFSTPVIMGALPKEVIEKIINQEKTQIQYCYEIELQRGPVSDGTINVKWIIAATGSVAKAMVTDSTLKNRNVERCITAKIKHWKFPPPAGGGIVEVNYPFIFRSSGGKTPPPPAPPTAARLFLDERAVVEGVKFKEATGYWKNTYVPGDPAMRLLHSRLGQRDRDTVLAGIASGLRLDDAARQYAQPFDVPTNSALAVFLHSDRRYAQGRTRALVQVGLKGTPRYSGSRPAMNLGVVLDMRQPVSGETGAAIRALVMALGIARDIGDRFSLIVAGSPGGVMVPADSFKHGPLTVAMQQLLNGESTGITLGLADAVQTAITTVVGADDPSTPLGSSLVLLVTPNDLSVHVELLTTMAHESAVNGVPMSVVGVGNGINLQQLDSITLAGQGSRRLLTAAAGARSLVDRELSAVSRVIARAVRLRIRLAPGVELVDVVGSYRLDEARAEMVRQAEQSIDRRISRNLGLQSDRGDDEEGIQIVIPSYYAGDTHVVLLDVVLPDHGPVADVRVRYKDLVFLRNGVSRANLSVERYPRLAGPLELNVLKNFIARRLSDALTKAGEQVAAGNEAAAIQIISDQQELLRTLRLEIPGLASDRDILADIRMLGEYQLTVLTRVVEAPERRAYIADSLRLAAFLKVLPRPLKN
ncbi:MAG: AgmX/PglI C-terminal domain-containing protein, partial [Myxococcota bacterium]